MADDPLVGFDVVTVAISEYGDPCLADLPDAETETNRVAELFSRAGGRHQSWKVPAHHRTRAVVGTRLDAWAAPDSPRNSVLVWIGHGESHGDRAWLAVHGSSSQGRSSWYNERDLAQAIEHEWRRRL